METAATAARPVLALDCDDVLFPLVPTLIEWHNRTHGTHLTLDDFVSCRFSGVFGCTEEESSARMLAYFASAEFLHAEPLEGAVSGVALLAERFEVHLVTARAHHLREITEAWIARYFPACFAGLHFGNHWSASGTKLTKAEMCRAVGAIGLVDDNPSYCSQVASANAIPVVMLDLGGRYPWGQPERSTEPDAHALPALVERKLNWAEVVAFWNERA